MCTERPTLAEVHKKITEIWSHRGTCNRAQVGCTLVRDGHTVASSFNGSPAKTPHCVDVGCLIQVRDGRESCIRTLHAEQALISFCARRGISTDGTSMWVTLAPCYDCAKLILNAGIQEVYYRDEYGGSHGISLLQDAGLIVKPWSEVV